MRIRKRRVFVVARMFQYSFILLQVACALAAFGLVYFATNSTLESVEPFVARSGADGRVLMRELSFSLRATIWGAAGFICVMMITWGIFTLQKVAGPLYRLQKHMQEDAGARKLTPVYFRKGDFFPELSETYNHLAESVPVAEPPPAPPPKTE